MEEKNECVFLAVQEMIKRMKEEIARVQNVEYPEQIVVAKIYELTANTLAKACRNHYKKKLENCSVENDIKNFDITMDTFILLKQLKDDNLISEEYADILFDSLLEMKPEIKEQVMRDKERGLL